MIWGIKLLLPLDKLHVGLRNSMTISKTNIKKQSIRRDTIRLPLKLKTFLQPFMKNNYLFPQKNSIQRLMPFLLLLEEPNWWMREWLLSRKVNLNTSSYSQHLWESSGILMRNWIQSMNNGMNSCRDIYWMHLIV